MASIQHPSSLNPWKQYRQACSILRNTSRAKNPAWYQSALELDLQLHIRPDGPFVFSSYFNRKTSTWTPGPQLTEDIMHSEEQFEPILADILKFAHSNAATSLGVIVHVADEFAITEIKPELNNPAALPDLRDAAVNEPTEILEDSSIDSEQSSWRVIPYPASGSEVIGTTITVTRQFGPFLSVLRKAGERANFPIITHVLSAPLVAVMGLPQMLKAQPEKPFVTILQYPWFTVLAFFNEHADLRLIRTLQHRGTRRAANFRNALFATSASLEFLDPDVFIVPLGHDIDDTLENNLRANFANSKVETLEVPTTEGVPVWCPEPIISALPPNGKSTVTSLTFSSYREDAWALQDFIPTPRKVVEIYPSKSEMGMLRLSRILKYTVAAFTFAGLGFFALGIFNLVQRSEWSFEPEDAVKAKAHLSELTSERKRIDHWNNLLADRSKAWIEMESFARMFPQDGGVLVKNWSYTAKPDTTPGKATIGFVKSWKISGFARDKALEYLNALNTQDGINKHFKQIARATGNKAFDVDLGNRSISVNVRTQENRGFRPVAFEEMVMTDPGSYPYTFDFTITQRFESTDPMALTIPKAP